MRDLTFSFFFPLFFVGTSVLAACTLPEGGAHARCNEDAVCGQGLVCYRSFCVESSQVPDGSMGGGDDVQALPHADAQVLDATAQPDGGQGTDALLPSLDASAPPDAGPAPDAQSAFDAHVVNPDAQVASPDAQVAEPDASRPVDAGQPQDAGPKPAPCKGKKCCKDGKPKPCDDD